uniref:Orf67 n=1 Tax=Acavomonas peruviana TaxID=1542312 RepID=V5KWI8_9ALVE|nr:orf67 [Acavomonas peruviana]
MYFIGYKDYYLKKKKKNYIKNNFIDICNDIYYVSETINKYYFNPIKYFNMVNYKYYYIYYYNSFVKK